MRNIIHLSVLFLCGLYFLNLQAAEDIVTGEVNQRLNLILIVTDNQHPDLLGAYGNPTIRTPNIDILAEQGVRFTSAHAVSGVCSPSRATLLTGLLPSQTGVHNALPGRPPIDDWSAISEFRNLPMTLKAAGYKTSLIGKYHLGRHDRAQLGFDDWVTFPSGHTESFYNVGVIDNGAGYVVGSHITDFWTKKAIERIQAWRDKTPYFLMLSFNGPYSLPPVVNELYENRHTGQYIENPPSMPQEPVNPALENWAREGDPRTYSEAHGITPWAAIQALNNRRSMANIAAETSMIDDGVGRLMAALKESGQLENTLVIYTSDQGAAFGQRGLWGNSSWAWPFAAYDANTRIPLIIRLPGNRAIRGQTVVGIVNQYDVFPTILDLLGFSDINIQDSPGQSFAAAIRDNETLPGRAAYFDYLTTRAIRTTKYRYIEHLLHDKSELYDLLADPAEMTDLSAVPEYQAARQEMSGMLSQFFATYADEHYDLWHGGTAKARALDGTRADLYREKFPEWKGVEMVERKSYSH
jgi:arylsulfatase A-like enzyme